VNGETSGRLSRRGGPPSIGTLFVLRLLLIANALTLIAVAGLYLAYGSRPASFFVGGALLGFAAILLCFLPFTDPYRRDRGRERRALTFTGRR
jgi:hypothetical protein